MRGASTATRDRHDRGGLLHGEKMELPEGITEQQLMEAIENAVRILGPSFTFGIYELEDIRQEAMLEGMRVIARYDASRPLDNFIYTCVRNRLIRLKRDKLRRNDFPCKLCHAAEGNRSLHEDGQFCQKHLAWKKRNDAKAHLMRPLGLDHHDEEKSRHEEAVVSKVELREILSIIDEHLDVDLRATYLQMRAGKSVPPARRLAVENAVREILNAKSTENP